jgi:tRNA G18 (ribose-2'-O)-methylase SpoU
MNAGNLFRSAHAFGASFAFTIDSDLPLRVAGSDTSNAWTQMPYYRFDVVDALVLPAKCVLVGVELLDEAVELPSFRHPLQAAYVLGPEKGSLSPDLIERCAHVIKIPTQFCINVATAGAIVMYDRAISLGRYAERPVSSRGKPVEPPPHVQGVSILRTGDLEIDDQDRDEL